MRNRINKAYWHLYHIQRHGEIECSGCKQMLEDAMNILLELLKELKEIAQ